MRVLLLFPLLLCMYLDRSIKAESDIHHYNTLKKVDSLKVNRRHFDPDKGERQIIRKIDTRSAKSNTKDRGPQKRLFENVSKGNKHILMKSKKTHSNKAKSKPKLAKTGPKEGLSSGSKQLLIGKHSWVQDLASSFCKWLCSRTKKDYSDILSLVNDKGSCCPEKDYLNSNKQEYSSKKKHKSSKHSSSPLFVVLPLFPLTEAPKSDEIEPLQPNSNNDPQSEVTELPLPKSPPPVIPPSPISCPPQTISLEGCGLSAPQKTRIVNGQDAYPGEFPWAVLLFTMTSDTYGPSGQCGGTLISSGWIVSAAHCFYRKDTYDVVYASIGTTRMPEGYTTRMIEDYSTMKTIFQVIQHPEYSNWNLFNDIALLQLVEYVSFTDRILPICLATPEEEDQMYNYDPKATVVGWGFLKQTANTPSKSLQKVDLDVITLNKCYSYYSDRSHPMTRGNMCTYTKGKDACQGDSGSGLYHLTTRNHWVQVGVVSWGVGCAQAGSPGVYTRTVDKLQWIRTVINTTTC